MDTTNRKTIEPKNERCCGEDADVQTESSDCESCRSITIPEIIVPDDSHPFTVTQCIWSPEKKEAPIEPIPLKEDIKPIKKPKRSPKPKKSQTSIIESNDYNLPELSEILVLPLHDKDVAAISFGEILLISFHNQNPLKCSDDSFNFKNEKYVSIGGYCNNIQRDGRNIILYSASEFTCNGKGTRASIYSLCDSSFNLIEEKRNEEYINENGEKREKSIHLIRESIDGTDNKRVVAFRTENENKLVSKYHTKIRINVTGALLPDGMNMVLLRYLVSVGYIGKFDTWTVNINGRICRSEYIFKTFMKAKINATITDVIPVIRNVTSLVDPPEIIKMFFLPTGHMIRHAWEYYPFIIHINPLASVPPSGFILNSFETWQQQIELVSKYLDCKDSAQSKLKTYLDDKPEVRCMIKDYIALLLNIKPTNILELTIEYFMNLNGDVQTGTEELYEESDSDSDFVNLEETSDTDEEQLSDEEDQL